MSDEKDKEIAALKAQLEAANKKGTKEISFKIGEKGGLSVYGLGRFPVTLYKEQWTRLLGSADAIRQFIADNDAKLKAKE